MEIGRNGERPKDRSLRSFPPFSPVFRVSIIRGKSFRMYGVGGSSPPTSTKKRADFIRAFATGAYASGREAGFYDDHLTTPHRLWIPYRLTF